MTRMTAADVRTGAGVRAVIGLRRWPGRGVRRRNGRRRINAPVRRNRRLAAFDTRFVELVVGCDTSDERAAVGDEGVYATCINLSRAPAKTDYAIAERKGNNSLVLKFIRPFF
jgi:hypothetical protein